MSANDNSCSTCILLVDNDNDDLVSLTEKLENDGYQVSSATSGEHALDLIRESCFDLVLCNLHLQGMNGAQLTRAICRIHPQLPVIAMTTHNSIEESKRALAAGASDVITKPVEMTSLSFILENGLQRNQARAKRLSSERAEVLFKVVKALAAAIDAKSNYTSFHSARMAEMCIKIGKEMALTQEQLNMLELAAHIHDVGKIGTPNAVLMKPGRLSDDEWVDILKHPGLGANFLAGIDELSEVASIIRHHHEYMDGSGYPDGLKGNAIPMLARIMAVADAYEAMTSDRPYRKALSRYEALDELRLHTDRQFDLVVVNAMACVISRLDEQERREAA